MSRLPQIVSFLLLGGLAAAINWGVRFPLSLFMPFPAAVFVAYTIGMAAGFALYRVFVFPSSVLPVRIQVVLFLIVNAVGAAIVMGVSLGLLHAVFPALGFAIYPGAVAHGIGIAVGSVNNFIGHKYLTFRISRESGVPASSSLQH